MAFESWWKALEKKDEGGIGFPIPAVRRSKKYFDVDSNASTYPGNLKRSTGSRGTRSVLADRIGVGRVGGVVSRVGCRRRENTPLIYSCTIALASEPDKVLTLFHTQGETHGRAREQRGDTRFEFISPRRKEGRVERGGRWSCIEFFESF